MLNEYIERMNARIDQYHAVNNVVSVASFLNPIEPLIELTKQLELNETKNSQIRLINYK